MKFLAKIILLSVTIMIFGISASYGYMFGMLSPDDTTQSITTMESAYHFKLPMVSFIIDGYDKFNQNLIQNLAGELGTGRVYHITLSPAAGAFRGYSAKQVADGHFDRGYRMFFTTIKATGIKVVFRTMHEMNGGRYSWSGDPMHFKKARHRIHELSRKVGLDQSQILFDFSVNGWDMPVVDGSSPHQQALLITCTQQLRQQSGCLTREDFYPGDHYVDLMGVTFFNRGKATSDRQRLSPTQIMDEERFAIRPRLVASGKPVIVDEVGTTSVWYDQTYQRSKSQASYRANDGIGRKNTRLHQLASWAISKPELIALSYFNVDTTFGLALENPGEADRSAIDLVNERYYSNIIKLYEQSNNALINLFTTGTVTSDTKGWDAGFVVPIKGKTQQAEMQYTNLITTDMPSTHLSGQTIAQLITNKSRNRLSWD